MTRKPYVPQNIGELLDQVGGMMLSAPTFEDVTGYLPHVNIDTTFYSLNEGLLVVRKTLGEELFAQLRAMSDKMRALFESDPEDNTGDARAGRKIVLEMEEMLTNVAKREAAK